MVAVVRELEALRAEAQKLQEQIEKLTILQERRLRDRLEPILQTWTGRWTPEESLAGVSREPGPAGEGADQELVSPKQYTTSALRLRSGPGIRHPIRTVVPRGAAVQVLREVGGWAEVDYRGQRGFVERQYLSTRRPGPAETPLAQRSQEIDDPIRKMAYAERELAAEKEMTAREMDRALADLEALLGTQAQHRREPVSVALIAP